MTKAGKAAAGNLRHSFRTYSHRNRTCTRIDTIAAADKLYSMLLVCSDFSICEAIFPCQSWRVGESIDGATGEDKGARKESKIKSKV